MSIHKPSILLEATTWLARPWHPKLRPSFNWSISTRWVATCPKRSMVDMDLSSWTSGQLEELGQFLGTILGHGWIRPISNVWPWISGASLCMSYGAGYGSEMGYQWMGLAMDPHTWWIWVFKQPKQGLLNSLEWMPCYSHISLCPLLAALHLHFMMYVAGDIAALYALHWDVDGDVQLHLPRGTGIRKGQRCLRRCHVLWDPGATAATPGKQNTLPRLCEVVAVPCCPLSVTGACCSIFLRGLQWIDVQTCAAPWRFWNVSWMIDVVCILFLKDLNNDAFCRILITWTHRLPWPQLRWANCPKYHHFCTHGGPACHWEVSGKFVKCTALANWAIHLDMFGCLGDVQYKHSHSELDPRWEMGVYEQRAMHSPCQQPARNGRHQRTRWLIANDQVVSWGNLTVRSVSKCVSSSVTMLQ